MNVKVSMDGHVYVRVPVEAVELMRREGYECYMRDETKDKIVKISADKHYSLDDVIWVYIGNACNLNKERMDKFTSVKDLARYAKENGKLPWGWRGIIRYKRWTRSPEKGTSVVVSDGVNTMRWWNKERKVVVEKT